MNQIKIEQIKFDIEKLQIKKLFKLNENGNKVKVRRDSENEFSIYLNGNFITIDETWEATFELVLTLINN